MSSWNLLRSLGLRSSKKPPNEVLCFARPALSRLHFLLETPFTVSLLLEQVVLFATLFEKSSSKMVATSERSAVEVDVAGEGPLVVPPKVTHSCLPMTVWPTWKLPILIVYWALSGFT